MSVYLQDVDVTLHHGDVLDVLRELPDESVDCAATSPPFYGLRDYGTGRWEGGDEGCDHSVALGDGAEKWNSSESHERPFRTGENYTHQKTTGNVCKCGARRIDQQIGLESTPEEWCDRLVEVFREVRRVLVPTGTLWVECGDSYTSGGRDNYGPSKPDKNAVLHNAPRAPQPANCKPKDLIGSPFLLAFGLRDDGWWWRSTNIWHKPNCLPESVTDRPVVSHSYVFQFSKKARYFHDAEAVREPHQFDGRKKLTHDHAVNGSHENYSNFGTDQDRWPNSGRSLRSVWTIPTQGYPEAHFATWPEALARRIILAGCPEQVCGECGVARTRIVESERSYDHVTSAAGKSKDGPYASQTGDGEGTHDIRHGVFAHRTTLGYTDCGHNAYRPGVVLDPFVGSGTTCFVARKHGRRSIGIDLSSEYLALAAKRLAQQSLLAVEA